MSRSHNLADTMVCGCRRRRRPSNTEPESRAPAIVKSARRADLAEARGSVTLLLCNYRGQAKPQQ